MEAITRTISADCSRYAWHPDESDNGLIQTNYSGNFKGSGHAETPASHLLFPADGTRFGFKTIAQIANAVQQVSAALLFKRAIAEGRSDPAIAVAEGMYEGDLRQAKNLIVSARRNGYLTSGQKVSGRLQGQLTPAGRALIDSLSKERKHEHSSAQGHWQMARPLHGPRWQNPQQGL